MHILEFLSARICAVQVMDLRITLRHLCIPLGELSFMFGENYTVVDNSMTPHAKFHQRHVTLSFHRVRETIVVKIFTCHFVRGMINPADVLIKHWIHANVWNLLKPLLSGKVIPWIA